MAHQLAARRVQQRPDQGAGTLVGQIGSGLLQQGDGEHFLDQVALIAEMPLVHRQTHAEPPAGIGQLDDEIECARAGLLAREDAVAAEALGQHLADHGLKRVAVDDHVPIDGQGVSFG